MVKGIFFGSFVALGLLLAWQTIMLEKADKAIGVLKTDNQKLLIAHEAQAKVILAQEEEARKLSAILLDRDAIIDKLHVNALQIQNDLQQANNSPDAGPACNIDAPLPESLSGPLRVYAAKTANSNRTTGNSTNSTAGSIQR